MTKPSSIYSKSKKKMPRKPNYCCAENCKTQAYFGPPGSKTTEARWCSRHKPPGAVDLIHRKCVCGKHEPSYGLEGSKPLWCASCPERPAEAEYLQKGKALCQCPKKKRPAHFWLPSEGGSKPRYCSECRPEGSINVHESRCDCGSGSVKIYAIWDGNKDEKPKPTWCCKCPGKPEGAKDVVSMLCECELAVQPSFGIPDGNGKEPGVVKLRWCSKCPGRPPNAEYLRPKRRRV